MKKFLGLEQISAAKSIPAELDARILAAAGLKARSLHRKKVLTKIVFPSLVTTSAAAAAAVVMMLPENIPHRETSRPGIINRPTVSAVAKVSAPAANAPAAVSQSDMLAMADFSTMEQEYYNLANIAEFSLDGDNFSM
jgi:hypothetical protein